MSHFHTHNIMAYKLFEVMGIFNIKGQTSSLLPKIPQGQLSDISKGKLKCVYVCVYEDPIQWDLCKALRASKSFTKALYEVGFIHTYIHTCQSFSYGYGGALQSPHRAAFMKVPYKGGYQNPYTEMALQSLMHFVQHTYTHMHISVFFLQL